MKNACLGTAFAALFALAAGCGGGGGGTPNPPPDLTETINKVLAAYDDCAGELTGDLFGIIEKFAELMDPTTPPPDLTIISTDAAAGQIDVSGDLDGDQVDELSAVITVLVTGTEDPPAGFDADAFATNLDGFAAAVAGTSGDVTVEFNFGAVNPGVKDLLGNVTAQVQDGVVQGFDASVDGLTITCSVNVAVMGAPGNAFAGSYPSYTASGRVDSVDIGFDFVVTFNGTSVATVAISVSPDIELNGTVDLDTGDITITQ